MFAACGRRGRIDLHDGAEHHELPLRMARCRRCHDLEIHPLVDDAAIAEARMSDRTPDPPARSSLPRAAAKWATSTLLGKQWTLACARPLRGVQLRAAGQHQIGSPQESASSATQAGRRPLEPGQVVHAVEDGRRTARRWSVHGSAIGV